jgi:hypothetical protein
VKKQRIRKITHDLIVILIFGVCYLCFFIKTGVGIPCVINKLTGIKCPGCGMTHAIVELVNGNIKGAMEYNALVLNVFPALCLYLIYRCVRYIKGNDEKFYIWEYILLIVFCVAVVGYGLIRNIK